MYGRTILCGLGILIGVTPVPAFAAAIDEAFACQNRQRERRVELRHAERASRLPCQVVYWRDASRSDGGKPIWEAENDYGFCIEQTRALLQRLQDGGWSCRKLQLDEAAATETIPALAPRGLEAVPEPKPEPRPAPVVDRSTLDAALERDLSRLAELASAPGARFEVTATELGDLDMDGDEDAAVVLSYQAGAAEPAQFLMVYRYDGETFQPAAKTYLGRVGVGPSASAIERIDDGTIELWFEPGDTGSGVTRQRQVYLLEDGALVAQSPES
jgi:hypothetical protein